MNVGNVWMPMLCSPKINVTTRNTKDYIPHTKQAYVSVWCGTYKISQLAEYASRKMYCLITFFILSCCRQLQEPENDSLIKKPRTLFISAVATTAIDYRLFLFWD